MNDRPVNLNKARKARAKVKKRAQANENAAKFGQRKADKARDAAAVVAFRTKVDGHKRDP